MTSKSVINLNFVIKDFYLCALTWQCLYLAIRAFVSTPKLSIVSPICTLFFHVVVVAHICILIFSLLFLTTYLLHTQCGTLMSSYEELVISNVKYLLYHRRSGKVLVKIKQGELSIWNLCMKICHHSHLCISISFWLCVCCKF